ncbi:MAG TPA: hypothetical protein PLJ35_10690 [Anaerolineae bacterium]|nr:hypothetical protein [Anaerolineae bacterium]
MASKRIRWVALSLLCCLGCAAPPGGPALTPVPTPRPGGLYVDAAARLGPVSRYSYGSNTGPWQGVPVDLQAAYKESGLTFMRFPGGNWGDDHDIEAYQVDQFIALARQIGAEPLICVRLRGGTVEQAVALVQYCRDRGYGVRYWSIGNEPSLFDRTLPGYDTVRFNKEWREYAEAMRAADPEIILVGPDTHQFTGDPATDPKDAAGKDWLREFLRANGDLVGVVSVHRYPFPQGTNAPPPTVEQLFADAARWDDIIRNLRAVVRQEAGRDLPLGMLEFNSSWANQTGTETTTDSFYSALWLTDVLGRMIGQGTDIITHFALQCRPGAGGYGLLATYDVRPAYYAYQMYKGFGQERLAASCDRPGLSLYAAQRADGALTLLVVNLGAQAVRTPVTLEHFAPAGRAEVRLFDKDHKAEALAPVPVAERFECEFPARSATLLTIAGK